MNNFKSLVLSVVTAASTLGVVALSTPAQACEACSIKLNGTELNGISLQGVQFNGFQLNGVRLNDIKFNGFRINGTEATGVESGKAIAVTLPR